jgi:hypothetical protein
MADDGIYRKTEKGRNEIATRANKLGFRERALLIMVDDRTSRADLLARSKSVDAGVILDALLAAGFIEVGTGAVAPATAAGGGPSQDLRGAIQHALANYIGPMAEIVCAECFARHREPDALIQALAAEIPGPDRAARFRAEVAALFG